MADLIKMDFAGFNYGLAPSMFLWEQTETSQKPPPDSGDGNVNIDSGIRDPETDALTEKTYVIYKFDAVPSEGHSAQVQVTKFPMSDGFLVSDHIIKQNRVLKLKVVAVNMVNSSLWVTQLPGAISAAGGVLGMPIISVLGSATGLVMTAFEAQDRVKNAFKTFTDLMGSGTRIHVNTILGAYTNCVITGIEVTQDKDTSTIMAAELTLEELQVVAPPGSDEEQALTNIRTKLEDMTDYSKFIKMGVSVGVSMAGRVLNT